MSLKIFLLGQFKLQKDDYTFELPSRPAQSLFAYLALKAGVTHRRETLASLIWPEATETNARSYLRQALWRIHKSLEGGNIAWEDYLQINDIDVLFNERSDYWLDANLLLETIDEKSMEDLIGIAHLYRGELLPGFYEDWVVAERDRFQGAYHQKMDYLLSRLIQKERWEETLQWGELWIQRDHAPEPAFRALMLAYAGLGDQSMVSATYQRCLEALDRDLSIEPSSETRMLYEKIIHDDLEEFKTPQPIFTEFGKQLPNFLDDSEPEKVERIIFVARQHELTRLDGYLKLTLSGKGRVAFVTGEAGAGKTTLISEFSRHAQETYPNLIVASGNCNAHTGTGDPYLPFREILGLLTGDVEARWVAGAITKEHARRLWNTTPLTAESLVESGPDLIDTFISGSALVNRIEAHPLNDAGRLASLREIIEGKNSPAFIPSPQQNALFEQYTRVLQTLSRKVPLVLVLDDLQWVDSGSAGLLFHLGRQLSGSPILIIGAYRPEEVALGREGTRHPLETVINEFQRAYGAISVNLEAVDRLEFVDSFLDSEPNHLGPAFRGMLFQRTQGHPLFTIELLRGMQERGDLVQNQEGQWVEGNVLDWETIPARVEAVIAERISRMPRHLQVALQVASVEGEVFTAEVVARVMETDERELLAHLSGELDRRHRLIRAERIQRLRGQLLSSYRFRHILFQKYLYSSLDEVERVHLHERVGLALEGLYEDQDEIAVAAPQLARHFEESGMSAKAVHYLHQAGERSVHLSAYQEGIAHLEKGLELLYLLPESRERDQQELTLQLSIGMARRYQGPTPLAEKAITRARELCQQLGQTAQLSRVMGELSIHYYVRAEYNHSLEFASEALSLAQQTEDQVLEAEGHWYQGFLYFCLGDYVTARTHLEQVISFYNPEKHHHSLVFLRGVDAGVSALAYLACSMWCLGYPDQARKCSRKALVLARGFNHPFTLADVLCYAGCMFNTMCRDPLALKEEAQALMRVANQKGLSGWLATATSCLGESLVMLGKIQDGIAQIRKGMAIGESSRVKLYKSITLRSLAMALAEAGDIQAGLDTLAEALSVVERTGERHWEAELYRIWAEFLLKQRDEAGAESNFLKAIEVSQGQHAKSWELRASLGLARLWGQQGKQAEARRMLSDIYNWFTEGFDTPDLIEAKALLDELT